MSRSFPALSFLAKNLNETQTKTRYFFYFYSEISSAFQGPSVTRRHGAYPQLPASILLIQVILPISVSNRTNKHREREKMCVHGHTQEGDKADAKVQIFFTRY